MPPTFLIISLLPVTDRTLMNSARFGHRATEDEKKIDPTFWMAVARENGVFEVIIFVDGVDEKSPV